MGKEETKIRALLKAYSQRPIAYQKIYAQITKSITAGLLLSQIAYWWYDVNKEKEFYKTNAEFREELGMGPREFKTAKAKLKELNLIKTTRKGVPCRTFYKLEEKVLLEKISSWFKPSQLDGSKGANRQSQNEPTTTDNTKEITTEIGNEISPGKLSEADAQARAYDLLTEPHIGVAQKVAHSIVYEQHVPLESIEETIKNGLAREKYEEGFVLQPGYIVAALNGARREGKVVGPTRKSRLFKEHLDQLNKAKNRTPLTQKEFAEKKKNQITALQATS